MAPGDQVERVLDLVRARGGRITTARRAILQALVDHDRHPTAEQLTDRVHSAHPDVDKSTVYRFLDDLEKLDVVDHVHLGHGPAVYHFVEESHQHLVCEQCGAVTEIPTAMLDELQRSLSAEFKFDLEPRHFALPGRCAGCRTASSRRSV